MRPLLFFIAAISLLSCDGLLAPSDIAGVYVAAAVEVSGAQSGELITLGGSLEMTLTDAGTTTGSMVVPADMSESGSQETYDLTGTFTIDENEVVRFDHSADTFIRDGDWFATRGTLRTTVHQGGLNIYAAMQRQ